MIQILPPIPEESNKGVTVYGHKVVGDTYVRAKTPDAIKQRCYKATYLAKSHRQEPINVCVWGGGGVLYYKAT